jgi:hypothetical protein
MPPLPKSAQFVCAFILLASPALSLAQPIPVKQPPRLEKIMTVPAPQGVAVQLTPAGVQVSWQAVAAAAQYVVLRAPSAGVKSVPIGRTAPGTLTYVDAGFNAPAVYEVAALMANGTQGASATVTYTPAAFAPASTGRPIAIADPRLRVTFGSVTPNPFPSGLSYLLVTGHAFDILTGVRIGGVAQTYKKVTCGGAGTGAPLVDGGDSLIAITSPTGLVAGANTIQFDWQKGSTTGSFTVAKVAITRVSPESAKPGETIAIYGEHLADSYNFTRVGPCMNLATNTLGTPTVTFNGYAGTGVATDGVFLNVQVPSHATGTLMVSTGFAGSAQWSKKFTQTPVPSGVQLGYVLSGTSAFVTGTAMDGVDSVYLSGIKAPIVTKSYDRLSFSIPAAVTGPADYNVTLYANVPGNFVNFAGVPARLTVMPVLKINTVSADSAFPGDQVSLTGPALGAPMPGSPSWKASISFNGLVSPSTTTNSYDMLSGVVPNDATTGPITVSGMTGQITGPSIRIVRRPRLSSIYPGYGQHVGQPIQIILLSGSPPTAISFGGFSATSGWTLAPDYGRYEIRMNVPAGALTGPVIVTTKDGSSLWTAAPWPVLP